MQHEHNLKYENEIPHSYHDLHSYRKKQQPNSYTRTHDKCFSNFASVYNFFVTEPKKKTAHSSICSTKVYHYLSLLHSGSPYLFTIRLSLKYILKRTLKTPLLTSPKKASEQNGQVIAQLCFQAKNYKLNFVQQPQ